MHKLFSICRLVGVVIALLMLASCASNQLATKASSATDSSCHMWCHNGWCSKHCDDGDGN